MISTSREGRRRDTSAAPRRPRSRTWFHFNAAEHLNVDPCAREPRVPLMVVFQTAKLRRGVRMFPRDPVNCRQSPDYHNLNNKFCLQSARSTTNAKRAADPKLARLRRHFGSGTGLASCQHGVRPLRGTAPPKVRQNPGSGYWIDSPVLVREPTRTRCFVLFWPQYRSAIHRAPMLSLGAFVARAYVCVIGYFAKISSARLKR